MSVILHKVHESTLACMSLQEVTELINQTQKLNEGIEISLEISSFPDPYEDYEDNYLTFTREYTEEEYEKLHEDSEVHFKKVRYENYLKLKQEFEGTDE